MRTEPLDRYDDMLDLPHPEPDPVRHPRMSREARAGQFAPFAALTGFGALIAEAGLPEAEAPEEPAPWD